MTIGIFADLHGNIDAWHTIMDGVFKDVDQILCAGDTFGAGLANPFSSWYHPHKIKELVHTSKIPITMVRGNCDPKGLYPDSLTGEIFGRKFYLCHGQHCSSDQEKVALAKKEQAAFLIYGHTHEWRLEYVDGILLINPGSPTMPTLKPKHDTVAVCTEDKCMIVDIHSQETVKTISIL